MVVLVACRQRTFVPITPRRVGIENAEFALGEFALGELARVETLPGLEAADIPAHIPTCYLGPLFFGPVQGFVLLVRLKAHYLGMKRPW